MLLLFFDLRLKKICRTWCWTVQEDISIEGYGFIETTSDGSGFASISGFPGFTCSYKLVKILIPFCFAFTRNPSYFLNSSFLQTMLISAGERILSESIKYMDRKSQDFASSWCLSSISLVGGFKLRISSIASPSPSRDRQASFCTVEYNAEADKLGTGLAVINIDATFYC